MWNGKNKAVTFSFDDGVEQDKLLIPILDKYNLKATFNLNSGVFGFKGQLEREKFTCPYNHIISREIKEVYKNHEIAVHTIVHPDLTSLEEDDAIVWQIEGDRRHLESFCDYPIQCMAYPGGRTDERVIKLIKENTPIKFARGVVSTHGFDLQDDLLNFCPTVHWEDPNIFEDIENFLNRKSDKPQLLYIWGHAYEIDFGCRLITLEKFEKICEMLANHNDIYYGTNSQVLFEK